MYQPLHSWSPLCKCDSESCLVSYCLPAHVYAKGHKGYLFYFLLYSAVILQLRAIYVEIFVQHYYACPSKEASECIGLGDTCEQHYMVINGVTTPCLYENVCIHAVESCIIPSSIPYWILGFLYFSLFSMHYELRKRVKQDKQIQGSDAVESICCSTCGLAQVYREIV